MISSKTFKQITTVNPNRALKNSIERFKQNYTESKDDNISKKYYGFNRRSYVIIKKLLKMDNIPDNFICSVRLIYSLKIL